MQDLYLRQATQDFQQLQKKLHDTAHLLQALPRAKLYAKGIDHLIVSLYADEAELPFAIVATGGYGRARLAPYSDIDLLFIHSEGELSPKNHQLIERCLYVLWDLHITVGHNRGSSNEIMASACADIPFATALIDARFLSGNLEIYADFIKMRQSEMARLLPREEFIAAKILETKRRHGKHGKSRYMLEPNIKEGRGGLRDLDMLYWICSYAPEQKSVQDLQALGNILGNSSYHTYLQLENFLWEVRTAMHDVSGHKDESLILEIQPEIAQKLGYRASKNNIGKIVERFMRHYFLNARKVGFLAKIVTAEIEINATRKIYALPKQASNMIGNFHQEGRFLTFQNEQQLQDNPLNMLNIFQIAVENNLRIHPHAILLLTQHKKLLVPYRKDERANALFMDILTAPKNGAWALKRLNETGLLGEFIPQFRNIIAQMQFNRYHHYTTDAHTIYAIDIMAKIEQGQLQAEFPLASIVGKEGNYRRKLLYCALFLHDIGKGKTKPHSIVGSEIAYDLCPRLGFNDEETEIVAWLVLNHLVMSHTAFTRDLLARKTLIDFATLVQNVERLRLLFMVTLADIRAVSDVSLDRI